MTRKGLEQAKNLINDYNAGLIRTTDPEKLWKAKKSRLQFYIPVVHSCFFTSVLKFFSSLLNIVVNSTIHPDTGEPVFLPFRMSCFVPTNLVVVAGMLTPNPSVC